MSTVSFVTCETYDRPQVEVAVSHAVDLLGGMERFVKSGDRVLLKPNLLSADPPDRLITTHPEVVRALATLVLDAGATPRIGDSPAIHPFGRVAQKTGMAAVAKELSIDLVEFDNPRVVDPPNGSAFKNIEIASQVLDADVIINIPKLKTHSQMLLTLGIKNLFGTVVGNRKGEWHFMAGVDRDIFASLLLDIYLIANPAFTLVDGIWGMEGHGPSNGDPRRVGLIAAGDDAVSLDTAICYALGASLSAFAFFRVARKRGIGETDVKNISFKGKTLEEVAVPDFNIPQLDSVSFLPGYLNRFARRALVSKPIHVGDDCSECRQCEDVCPADAISVKDKKGTIDYERCIRCFCCQEVCPENAIRFHQGLLLRLSNILKGRFHR